MVGTAVLHGRYWSTKQEGLEYQAGGTGVPSRWDWSTKQVGLRSRPYLHEHTDIGINKRKWHTVNHDSMPLSLVVSSNSMS